MRPPARDGAQDREHGLDWLRVLAFALMIPYHVSLIFTVRGWFVTNGDLSGGLYRVMRVVNVFRIPLLFFVSGFVLAKVIWTRPDGAVLKERVLRLGVPLAFGTAFLVPPQRFLGWLARGDGRPYGDLLLWSSFSPESFWPRNFVWHHLWFLAYLLLFSCAVVLTRRVVPWKLLRERMGPASVLAVGLVLLLAVDVLFKGYMPSTNNLYDDRANLLTCLVVFAIGFGLRYGPSAGSLWKHVDRLKWPALVVAAAATIALDRFPPVFFVGNAPWDLQLAVRRAVKAVSLVAWLVLLLGFSRAYLSRRPSRLLSYCNEAVLPWYVLHQTVIVVVGFALMSVSLPLWPKFVLEVVLSLAGTVALYEVGIRRRPVARALFGMKPLAAGGEARVPAGRTA